MLSTQGAKDGFSFQGIIAEGTYKFKVVEAEVKKSQAGNLYNKLVAECVDSEQKGKKVYHNLNWTESTAETSLAVLVALGVKAEFDETDATDLKDLCKKMVGKKFTGRVYHHESTYNGKERVSAVFGAIEKSGAGSAPVIDDDDDGDLPF